jgi:hypothetical protein
VLISQLIGSLFYINGCNHLWSFFFPSADLEVIRTGRGWWTFLLPTFDQISHVLHFITIFGFIGLVTAGIVNWCICKRKGYSVINAVVAFVTAFLLNGIFIGDLLFFKPDHNFFANFSMHTYFLFNIALALLIGSMFLIFPIYLRYFKIGNRGGIR